MSTLAKRIEDKRLLRLVRAFLNAGAMENGLVKPTEEGTPQGGNLSPLLSNIVLDELDKELEKRGHRFARYADDCAPQAHKRKSVFKRTELIKCISCIRDGGRPSKTDLQGQVLNNHELLC